MFVNFVEIQCLKHTNVKVVEIPCLKPTNVKIVEIQGLKHTNVKIVEIQGLKHTQCKVQLFRIILLLYSRYSKSTRNIRRISFRAPRREI